MANGQSLNYKFLNIHKLHIMKVNQWDIYYRKDEDQPFELIGSRLYDEAGNMKIGKWNEISLRHDNMSQVMYQGEYSNYRQVAKWDILYRKDEQIAYKQLRGGLYDEEGSNKIGYQTELSDEFIYESQIVFYDEYQNGKKVSKWIIREEGDYFCGETYNQVGLIKVGKWIELKDGFDRWFQAIYYGEYKDVVADHMIKSVQLKLEGGKSQVKDSRIILKSRIMVIITVVKNLEDGTSCMRKPIYKQLEYRQAFQIIHKSLIMVSTTNIGMWIEECDSFNEYTQVTYNGEYKNCRKVGRWDILYRKQYCQKKNTSGGGLYNQEDSLKTSLWIKLSNYFSKEQQFINHDELKKRKQKSQQAEMDQLSNKIRDQIQQDNRTIHHYNNNYLSYKIILNEMKLIILIFICFFKINPKFTFLIISYMQVAKWDILYRKDEQIAYKQLRGGLYDEEGSNKIGYQTELSDEFIYESQIVFYDEYQKGKKVSKWIIREEGDYLQHYLIDKNIIVVEKHIIKQVQLRLESGLN
ncbi:unnamed protein product [Paramecium primaurelia]|uniref:MORN repeat protein n=1 Tax=Paramecium primaurelia TaxID=5886 RepID=A0A8S1QS90_PARPR|nr:unnamed protein product [Paramecium primaurelia]